MGTPDISVLGTPVATPVDVTGNILRAVQIGTAYSSQFPMYLAVGGNTATQYYYLAAHNDSITAPANCSTGGDCISIPMPIGCAQVTIPRPTMCRLYSWAGEQTMPRLTLALAPTIY